MSHGIDPSPWSGLSLLEPLSGGHRNLVLRGTLAGATVAVRRSRRSSASLAWELNLLEHLAQQGFVVPAAVAADDGRRAVGGVTVHRWLEGREPSSNSDWHLVAAELQRLHDETSGYGQRPGCSTVCGLASAGRSVDADLRRMPDAVVGQILAVFENLAEVPAAVIHGDPMPGNIRIGSDGSVGLLDWDESRVDLVWHDLSNLGVQILDDESHRRAERLSNAWEAANGWLVEPEYARRRLAMLAGD